VYKVHIYILRNLTCLTPYMYIQTKSVQTPTVCTLQGYDYSTHLNSLSVCDGLNVGIGLVCLLVLEQVCRTGTRSTRFDTLKVQFPEQDS
jgi:hypothetical protein